LGRLPNPLDWPPVDRIGANRFDDPARHFRVLYAARQRTACFAEPTFRHDALSIDQAVVHDKLAETRIVAQRGSDSAAGEAHSTRRCRFARRVQPQSSSDPIFAFSTVFSDNFPLLATEYIATKLFEINERATFIDPGLLDEAKMLAQDEEIFNIARLVNW